MKIAVISEKAHLQEQVRDYTAAGFIVFIYHHVDPDHELAHKRFLYIHDEAELKEKINLLNSDVTVQDLLR